MSDVSSPVVLTLATFSPCLGAIDPILGELAQQISAVGVMAFFLWRETKLNQELKKELKDLRDKLHELLMRDRGSHNTPTDKS